MAASLAYDLPPCDALSDDILARFLLYVAERELDLYAAQEEAILEILSGNNVILNTPTGSGKSLVAEAAHFEALVRRERSIYTCPIKALANEKFFALVQVFGADNVGLMTGDATVNRDAPILCATAEVVANMALVHGADADIDMCIVDEFHYYSDRDRGTAWQIPLLALSNTRFLLMSATLGDPTPFQERLTKLNRRPTAVVRSFERPVPLDYEYRETPLHETVAHLVQRGKAPIYIVNFTQRSCAEEAQNLMSVDFCTKEEKRGIVEALHGARFDSPYGREIQRFVRHGIGIHHAGLLPKYRLLVEKLAQKGHLKIISGTDTLGVGVNIPIRTVLFTRLCKFDGEKTAILSVRDFQQISGRAGRRGFDTQGSVVAQAPEHVIENLRLEAKAGNDPVKKKRIVRKKPPDRGYVAWDNTTFERLTTSEPEALVSRFKLTHATVATVLTRPGGGCMALARLVRRSHERPPQQRALGRTAFEMIASLRSADVLCLDQGRFTLNVDLGEDFSIRQALSLYVLDTLRLLDPDDPAYGLHVLTLVESSLENPDVVLLRQLDKLKQAKLAELKAAGVEYEQRMEELEKLEYPKPDRDFMYDTFNAFARKHPWIREDNIRPKSVARDMFEQVMSFSETVREYGLERSEGVLLRYLSDAYKALEQTVPTWAKNEHVEEVSTWLGAVVRQVDASLLDEWERMRNPAERIEAAPEREELEPAGGVDITRDRKAFVVLIRNEVFRFVRALARRDYLEAALTLRASDDEAHVQARDAATLEAALAPFFKDHATLRTDPQARNPAHLTVTPKADAESLWHIRQVLLDSDDDNDWSFEALVDLEESKKAGRPVLTLERLGT